MSPISLKETQSIALKGDLAPCWTRTRALDPIPRPFRERVRLEKGVSAHCRSGNLAFDVTRSDPRKIGRFKAGVVGDWERHDDER